MDAKTFHNHKACAINEAKEVVPIVSTKINERSRIGLYRDPSRKIPVPDSRQPTF